MGSLIAEASALKNDVAVFVRAGTTVARQGELFAKMAAMQKRCKEVDDLTQRLCELEGKGHSSRIKWPTVHPL